MPVDGDHARTAAASRITLTTRSCVSAGMPAHIGRARFSADGLLGLGQRACLPAEVAQRRLQVERRDVVRGVADPGRRERLAEAVALGRADDVHVVDVAGLVGRQLAELAEPELLVARGGLAARGVPAVDLAEEEAQHGGLQLVEARVVADRLEVLLVARAVEAQHA